MTLQKRIVYDVEIFAHGIWWARHWDLEKKSDAIKQLSLYDGKKRIVKDTTITKITRKREVIKTK